MIDAIWTEGRKILGAKAVKKLPAGTMVHVLTEARGEAEDR